MERTTLDKYQIINRLADFYRWPSAEYYDVVSIFWKIETMVQQARTLRCPHCGKDGRFMTKTTVTKKKYRYRRLYVYHEIVPIPSLTSLRRQKWCYLNKSDLSDSTIRMSLRKWNHAQDVEEFLYKCIVLPSELKKATTR